jgi:hypothetical protein
VRLAPPPGAVAPPLRFGRALPALLHRRPAPPRPVRRAVFTRTLAPTVPSGTWWRRRPVAWRFAAAFAPRPRRRVRLFFLAGVGPSPGLAVAVCSGASASAGFGGSGAAAGFGGATAKGTIEP